MAVPAEPNAEALANLIQDQGQGQLLVQDQQIQAQEQQPQAQAQQPQGPPGAAAAQVQVGEVFRLCSVFIFAALRCASRRFFPCPGVSFCSFYVLIFALIIGTLVYMFIACFAKCCHLCVTLSQLSPRSHILLPCV